MKFWFISFHCDWEPYLDFLSFKMIVSNWGLNTIVSSNTSEIPRNQTETSRTSWSFGTLEGFISNDFNRGCNLAAITLKEWVAWFYDQMPSQCAWVFERKNSELFEVIFLYQSRITKTSQYEMFYSSFPLEKNGFPGTKLVINPL